METNTNPMATSDSLLVGNQPETISSPPVKKLKKWYLLAIVFILVAGGAYAAYHYDLYGKFFGDKLAKEAALAQAIENLVNLKSASYQSTFGASMEAKDPAMFTFDSLFAEDIDVLTAKIEHDQDRIRDIMDILKKINSHFKTNQSVYPDTISQLYTDGRFDNKDYVYNVGSDKKTFSLQATFETDQAIKYMQKKISTVDVSGKQITFDQADIVPTYWSNVKLEVSPTFLSGMTNEDLDDFFKYISTDFKVEMNIGGTSSQSTEETDASFNFGASGTFGSFSFAAKIEFIKSAEDFFVKIAEFPSIPIFDFSEIKGQWIQMDKNDLNSDSMTFGPLADMASEEKDKYKDVMDQLQLVLKWAHEEKLFDIDYDQPDQIINEREHFVYKFDINADSLKPFYDRAVAELATQYGDKAIIKSNESWQDFLSSTEMTRYIEYYNNNTDIVVYVDKDNYFFDKYEFAFHFVPGSKSKAADKQLTLAFKVELGDINKDIKIDRPSEFITLEDAEIAMTGMSREQYRFKKQVDNIRTIRDTLRYYHRYTDTYPETLEDLLKTRQELENTDSDTDSEDVYGIEDLQRANLGHQSLDKPLLKSIPRDAYTDEPYQYSSTGTDYALIYTINRQGIEVSENLMLTEYLAYVSGQNTSNSEEVSLEIVQSKEIDSDNDGLPNYVEDYYGSSNSQTDSDSDGYSDAEEVSNGYDPNGPGSLEYYEIWYGVDYDKF